VNCDELKRRFPGASAAFIRANCDDHPGWVYPRPVAKPAQGSALVKEPLRKGKGKGGAVQCPRYRITATVFAVKPRDWDNLAASLKQLQDEIVAAGWLPGDDWRQLDGRVVSAKAATVADERTEILLERMSP
jgi:hypothetical protein